MSKESKLMKNTAILAVGNVFTKCVSFFMLPLYTSMLTTEQYGTVDIISVVVSLLVIIMTFQLELGVFRFLIEARGNLEKQKRYISSTIVFVAIVNIAIATVAIIVLELLHYEYTYYLVINIVAGVANTLLLNIARGTGNNMVYAVGSCVNGVSCVLLNVYFIAVLHFGVYGMLLATILSLVVSTIYVFFSLKLWKYISFKSIQREELKELFDYSLPLIPYTLCWWVIRASSRVIINWGLGVAANGIYSIAFKFATLYTTATNIFQTAWMESASENVNDEERNEFYQSIYEKTIRFYSSCCVGIIGVLPLVFGMLVKNDFIVAYSYIPILLIAAFLQSVTSFLGSLYFAFKDTKGVAMTNVYAAVINVAITVIFIKFIGLYAAAFATLASYAIVAVIRCKDIKKYSPLKLGTKYLLQESSIYLLVLLAYYSKIFVFQIGVLVILVPYCVYQNKDVMNKLLHKLLRKKG